ncbi:LuxR C-terminal-related transcriptional regulator [Lysobacter sp. MMG2]|uniref:response regulator transcription factor n=1 Tax=Lysobacter sp. MMG2 TaxID=2801338 RepID=UPI001C23E309|nr:LuxR C-terminal-related transcriptional regulator [Lysobacter sp. MMG2]MBU8978196.1 LuxR C-terminal-related transcriptional regulator [Lysobacter sp. MMG2]
MHTASMEVPAVYLLQGNLGIREALGRELSAAGYRVFSSASPSEFLASYVYDAPGCLVLDLGMPRCNQEVRAALDDRGLAPQIVYVAEHVDGEQALALAKGDTTDLILKPLCVETITAAITDAIARDAKAREIQLARSRLAQLKAREREVLTFLLEGHRNKNIADALGIAVKTVKVHRQRLMRNLEMRSVAELVQFAIAAGVNSVPVPPHSGHCGRRTGRRKGAVTQGASSFSMHRSAADQIDVEKRLMAAAIHELHALLSRAAGSHSVAQDCAAEQLAGALAPSAQSILEEGRIDVGAALEALDGLEQVLGADFLRNFRQTVLQLEPGQSAESGAIPEKFSH